MPNENFTHKKKYGQNFLFNDDIPKKIVSLSDLTPEHTVIEIGPGKGILTKQIASIAKRVYAFEIDVELKEILNNVCIEYNNVNIVFNDIMKIDLAKFVAENCPKDKIAVIANLPYYVTSPILTRFLQNPNLISATVMVQEEVADRIIAVPKTKDYGVLTVICQMFGEAKKVIRVNRKMFYPVPNVDSAVVHIEKTKSDVKDFTKFISFVKKAFAMRRKKLSTNLEIGKMSKSEIEDLLENSGFSRLCRAEELSISDFERLYNLICDKN
jgi:16S rRNA (adenine1518-N6/adenine1519-N6)-dimethyltransferase